MMARLGIATALVGTSSALGAGDPIGVAIFAAGALVVVALARWARA